MKNLSKIYDKSEDNATYLAKQIQISSNNFENQNCSDDAPLTNKGNRNETNSNQKNYDCKFNDNFNLKFKNVSLDINNESEQDKFKMRTPHQLLLNDSEAVSTNINRNINKSFMTSSKNEDLFKAQPNVIYNQNKDEIKVKMKKKELHKERKKFIIGNSNIKR